MEQPIKIETQVTHFYVTQRSKKNPKEKIVSSFN